MRRRILSLLLTFTMAFTMMPLVGGVAYAAGPSFTEQSLAYARIDTITSASEGAYYKYTNGYKYPVYVVVWDKTGGNLYSADIRGNFWATEPIKSRDDAAEGKGIKVEPNDTFYFVFSGEDQTAQLALTTNINDIDCGLKAADRDVITNMNEYEYYDGITAPDVYMPSFFTKDYDYELKYDDDKTNIGNHKIVVKAKNGGIPRLVGTKEVNYSIYGNLSGTCGTDASYSIDTRTGILNITGTGPMKDYSSSTTSVFCDGTIRPYVKKIIIGEGITRVGSCAFTNNHTVEEIILPSTLEELGWECFSKSSNVKKITLPKSIKTISSYVFNGWTSLETIEYAGSVSEWKSVSIGHDNPDIASKLEYINHTHNYIVTEEVISCTEAGHRTYTCECGKTYEETLPMHDYEVISDTPSTCVTMGETKYKCKKCEDIKTESKSLTAHSYDEYDVCSVCGFYNECSTQTSGTCGDNLTWNFDTDTKVLTISGTGPMRNFGTISNSVFKVVRPNVEKIIIDEGVTSIGSCSLNAMRNCAEVVLPSTLTSIGWGALSYYDSLSSIYLPKKLTEIDETAFANTNLSEIYYCGDSSDWSNIAIGSRNDTLTSATMHYDAHTWNAGVVTTAAGLWKDGVKTYTCDGCGETKTATINGYCTYYVKSFKVSKGKKYFIAKWKKQSKANRKKFSGYQVEYSLYSNFKDSKKVTASTASKSKKVKGLKAKTYYYVHVRTYKYYGGKYYYSGWSSTKKVRTK